MNIDNLVKKYYDEIVKIRHQIHEYPETSLEEFETAKLIANKLEAMNIEVTKEVGITGVVGLIKGKYPGKTVLLRADMDALAINEEADVPYKSKRPGFMHACGHDGHVASLLGAAMVLNELKDQIHGNIKLMFQPAEELDGGALRMIESGILENPKVDAAFGLHLWGSSKEKTVYIKPGAVMAAPDEFEIEIIGKGGHGGVPNLSVDPIVIASEVVLALQSIVSRKMNPTDPAVVTVANFNSGNGPFNVIVNSVFLNGTIRTLSFENRKQIPILMENIVKGITLAHGADYKINFTYRYPPLINDNSMAQLVKKATIKVVGENNVIDQFEPTMGGEDFAYLANNIPSAFFFVGIAENENTPLIHHHPLFAWNDRNLLVSTNCLVQVALDFLADNNE